MCEELERLLKQEKEAAARAEEAINRLNGPQPIPAGKNAKAEELLAERIVAHERVTIHRAAHGC